MKRYIQSSSSPEYLLQKASTAAYGEDSLKYILKYIQVTNPDKLDGFEYDGSGFDVSYQGDQAELEQDIVDSYQAAGITLTDGYSANSLEYDNEDQSVSITINSGNDDYTFTDHSNGFYISVENLYE